MAPDLRFGWFIPTYGDLERYDDDASFTPPSLDLFVQIAKEAEEAGFEYALTPISASCWDAWVTCAMVAARTERLKPLIAVRSGYVLPAVLAKMASTFDQLTYGRLSLNLIAGPGGAESAAEGIYYTHDERYEVLDETVTLMKRLWTEDQPVSFVGKHFRLDGGSLTPRPYQQPHPRLYIGGISDAAKAVGVDNADCYYLWGDTPGHIRDQVAEIRRVAAARGRTRDLAFGIRLLIVVRETEEEAWKAAWNIVEGVSEEFKADVQNQYVESQAYQRQRQLAEAPDYRIGPHLWSGLAPVRAGVGTAVVGNPEQVAATLEEFVEAGCTEFCLSGYPNLGELRRFNEWVMPHFRGRLVEDGVG